MPNEFMRYGGWLMMAPLVLGAVAWGRAAVIVFVTALGIAAFLEFARATALAKNRLMSAVGIMAIVAVGVVIWVHDPRLEKPGWYGLFAVMPMWFTALLLVIPVLRNDPRGQLQAVALSLVGFTYFGWMFGHLAYLANSNNPYGYLLFLFFAVSVNDVAAFTFGKLVGSRKLCSRICPNKTWGGAGSFRCFNCDAVDAAFLVSTIRRHGAAAHRAHCRCRRPIGRLDNQLHQSRPGNQRHGKLDSRSRGNLDRIDSLIYTAPLFFHMVRWFYDI
jgi:phosphatidate cytidylyltransferase